MTTISTYRPSKPSPIINGREARLAARTNTILSTSGIAPGYLQANLIVLPSKFADDFRLLCTRNPVPCPLLAESASPGCYDLLKSYLPGRPDSDEFVAADLDLRTDAPRYMVYRDGTLLRESVQDVLKEWQDDHVAFLVGCSYSFEAALAAVGLPPRHMVFGRVVPMYRTRLPLHPAGVFSGSTVVVSMRPYRRRDIEVVRDVTRPYVATHGEPIAWGWEAVRALGIEDVNSPTWGEAPTTADGQPLKWGDEKNVPVFWGCGVTPQEAVMRAELSGIVVGHAPGHMLVLDARDDNLLGPRKWC